MNSTPPNLNDLKLTGLRKILIETPFGVVEAALDLAELATAKIPINPETNYPYEIYNSIDYGAILQAVKVASKSHDLFQFMTDAYRAPRIISSLQGRCGHEKAAEEAAQQENLISTLVEIV
jgi:hypothetical protein